MRLKEFLREELQLFLVLVTCIGFAMGVTGCIFDSERTFSYGQMFAPFIYASLYILLDIITYSKVELTKKQYRIRKAIQFMVYETIIILFVIIVNDVNKLIVSVLAISVPLVWLMASIIMYVLDIKKASVINTELKEYQKLHHF